MWECLKTNRVVISKTPRAGDVTVISRSSWIAPQFVKMNTDEAFSPLNGESGRGVVFRGCSAHVLKALSVRFGKLCSPRSAEFEALRVGLTEAIKLLYLTPILEMDCLPIVQAIQGKRPLLDEERKAVSSLPFHCLKDYSIVMMPREANSLADVLATTGLSGSTKTERDRALYSAHLVEQEDALRETRFRLRWLETVANEHDVQQTPVARTLVLAGKAQKEEMTIEILDELVEQGVRIKEEVIVQMKATVASKQFGQEDILCSLIADACIHVYPQNPANFNVDNVRVAKLLGGGLHDCTIVRGMVLKTDAVGYIQQVEKAKVVVFSGGVDTSATETKGTMQIHSAEQVNSRGSWNTDAYLIQILLGWYLSFLYAKFSWRTLLLAICVFLLEKYSKTEAAKVEELIKAVAESGAKVVVSGGAVGEMALHFCERYKLMVLKISSKFELQRFCRTTGAVAILKLGRPNPNDLGYVYSVSVEEIGGVRVTVVKNEGGNSVSTVVLQGSTDSILDDLERAVDDGVNTYKAMCRKSRMVPGAAATEVELTRKLKEFSFSETALYQFAIDKFAESFENAGPNAMEIISSLYAEHASGNSKVRIDLEEGICEDVSDMNIRDLHDTKFFALIHAADAACTALWVDQVTVVRNEEGGNSVSTVVQRGSTDSILDDLERAVDGLNTYKIVMGSIVGFLLFYSPIFPFSDPSFELNNNELANVSEGIVKLRVDRAWQKDDLLGAFA
ncbi:hypothetical protein RHGRI_006269 [Rhododendron griersonianum]|uniref:RNase H type-1 domain-containing protein n=1 Tax=Rhododendron griersonianum TaxID=479676 RepID=A0AAV6KSD2_9ERIC|nr:hypothetical protein RHGRI_006269 [Rhododendron griersonianum]